MWGFFKKREGITYYHVNRRFQVFSFSECLVCVLFISISIICVSQEEPNLIASNQEIYGFYK